jgi:hypothetical protein
MTLPTETDTPPCPNCSASMRLKRVLPTALPTDCTYSYVFGCTTAEQPSRAQSDLPLSLAAPVLMQSPRVSHTRKLTARHRRP